MQFVGLNHTRTAPRGYATNANLAVDRERAGGPYDPAARQALAALAQRPCPRHRRLG